MQALKVAACLPALFKSQIFVQIPYPTSDFTGQTVIVTGSNTSLGKEAVRHLARLGAKKVIMAVRTVSKGEAAAEDIIDSCDISSSTIEVCQLEMGDIASIKAFAERAASLDRLDAAILNAGVQSMQWNTIEGCETHIVINTLNTTLLAMLLLPKLQASARETGQGGRMTIVGSDLMYFANLSEFETRGSILDKVNNEEQSWPWAMQRYGHSKILLFWSIRELARRVRLTAESNVIVTVVTPGGCDTDLFRDYVNPTLKATVKSVLRLFNRAVEVGARTLVHAVSSELPADAHGRFLMDACIAADGMNVYTSQAQRLAKKWNDEVFSRQEKETGIEYKR